MHASHAFLMVFHAGFISISPIFFSFAAFERYTINKHYRRSLSGLSFQHQGNCWSAHHGFMTSISISIRGVFFFRALQFFFFGGIKSEPYQRLRFGDMGLRIDGSFQTLFPQLFPLLFLVHVQKFSMLLLHCQCHE